MTDAVLKVADLNVRFRQDGAETHAVRGVTFEVGRGETVALVGESGSGKSVTAQAILRILSNKARITSGSILFNDPTNPGRPIDLAALEAESAEMHALRGGRIAMIFQEPMNSLSPLHTVGDQV